jgi:hypothetical protein
LSRVFKTVILLSSPAVNKVNFDLIKFKCYIRLILKINQFCFQAISTFANTGRVIFVSPQSFWPCRDKIGHVTQLALLCERIFQVRLDLVFGAGPTLSI